MKRIQDIEKLQEEDLEMVALGEDITIPAGLEERLKAAIAAKEAVKPKAEPVRWIPYAALAVAAGFAAVAIIRHNGSGKLQDTFDDPYLAYAQVEATFQKISDKMAIGVDIAAKAEQTAEKPMEIINKIK
ncbi:MAG: hypothetical protein II424_04915 [Bacteroidales bacterium]|nr:hypothetical protein [Bacteroidales bacterium]